MPETNIRIVDIARRAGVSAGTVDRVIHHRGRVSSAKRELVEKALAEMNYEPNLVARFLASKKRYSIAVVIPAFEAGEYWELVHDGINRAWEELHRFNVDVKYFYFDQYDVNSFSKTTQDIVRLSFDGVMMATLAGDAAMEFSLLLDKCSTPYVYIDSNIPGQNNMAYYGCDSLVGGAMAARLLIREVGKNADLFFARVRFRHRAVSAQMLARQKGFEQYARMTHFGGNIYRMDLFPGDHMGNLTRLKKLIAKTDRPLGGIVFNSRIYELASTVHCLEVADKQRICLAGYDAIGKNVEALFGNQISFLLSQRPEIQGYNALKALGNLFLYGEKSEKINFMPIDILIRENIAFYNNYKL